MTATTMGGASANSTTNASPGANPTPSTSSQELQTLGQTLGDTSAKISSFADFLKGTPLDSLAGPVTAISETLGTAAQITSGIGTAIEENKGNGVVSQVLGVTESVLGNVSAAGGGEGETSFLDTMKEKVGQLKGIWDQYYQDLFTQEGKLNTERAKQMAMAVGDVLIGTKKMAKIRRAFAIGEVVRDTAVAIMKAAASKPFPANLVPIAKATAQGAASLAAVKGQAHDGLDSIPSTGTYLLEKGERVVGSRLNRDLTSYLAGGQSAPRQTTQTTGAPNITLNIGDNATPEAAYANRGVLETALREIYADYGLSDPFGAI